MPQQENLVVLVQDDPRDPYHEFGMGEPENIPLRRTTQQPPEFGQENMHRSLLPLPRNRNKIVLLQKHASIMVTPTV